MAAGTRDRRDVVTELRRRAGGHLDPDLVAAFATDPEQLWGVLDQPDLLTAVMDAEPGLPTVIRPQDRDRLCTAMAVVVDPKGRYLLGHSGHVAQLTYAAADLAGMARPERVAHKPSEAAAHLSAEAAAGRLDRDACAAVVEAADYDGALPMQRKRLSRSMIGLSAAAAPAVLPACSARSSFGQLINSVIPELPADASPMS
ncbi:hypothetical protein GFY24_04155 [Nocardia sp. SYP-A9097]|uniref:hypothetical protein n=1 Tax=Nocardia sp. SYP-A9097 TaxID=2663237 RepID=UPI00129A187C|nr:hypothetical protein [Nocardia sp. SYP-A9097]MRH86669.1 hypothetical protein [Nocardia sp. SYP-A9097]